MNRTVRLDTIAAMRQDYDSVRQKLEGLQEDHLREYYYRGKHPKRDDSPRGRAVRVRKSVLRREILRWREKHPARWEYICRKLKVSTDDRRKLQLATQNSRIAQRALWISFLAMLISAASMVLAYMAVLRGG